MENNLVFGIMGSSRGEIPDENIEKAFQLGVEIAKQGCTTLTGGCTGLPFQSLKGAESKNGETIVISPGRTKKEHTENYQSPLLQTNKVIYSGFGDMGRTILNIRTSDILVFVQGGAGTLAEFGQAIGEKKMIGVLINTGGISDKLRELLSVIDHKNEVIFEKDPVLLIRRLIDVYNSSTKQ